MANPDRSLVIAAFSLSAALMLAACVASELPGDESGTGGTSSAGAGGTTGIAGTGSAGHGAGGSTGPAGATGKGGVNAMGGTTAMGGVTGTGDRAGTDGGTPGAGGVSAMGGTTGMGGVTGMGGITGRGGAAGPGGRGGATGPGGRGGTIGAGGSTGRGGSTGTAGAPAPCSGAMVPSGGTSHCSSNQSGMVGSLQWTIWSSGSGGCLITYGSSPAFSATWNNSGDFLARVGLNLGSNKTYDQFGTMAADFAQTKSGSGGGYSSIGVYGWSVSPLVEWYVTEDSYNGLGSSGTKKGTFTIDGEGTYNVYQRMQNNQPSIQGTASFPQFISIRTSARTCGHISLTKHFDAWKGFGMTLGKMEEAKVLIEAGGGSGKIDFPVANVTAQ
jgi:endo-1,4-beta-xylanase